MLRKLLVASAASLALLSPLASPPPAQAHGRHRYRPHFEVVYRDCCTAPWRRFGTYRRLRRAERVAGKLQAQGFEALVH
jgi:hypothetical protein